MAENRDNMGVTHVNQNTKRFNVRVLTSLTVTLSFLCLAFSGIVLYFTPQGRVAHWVGWTMFGLDKEEWAGVHTLLAILFVIASAVHIYFNWRVLLRYFKDAIARGMRNRAELGIAALITALFFVGTLKMWPPFGTVIDWGERIKDYWERTSAPAPYAHAEESTLAEFAEILGISSDELAEQLRTKGLEVSDFSMTVDQLGRKHRVSPNKVFEAFPEPDLPAARRGLMQQSGYGRQTLKEVCDESGVELQRAIAALERYGITARGSDTVRSLAAQGRMRPREVFDIVTAQQ